MTILFANVIEDADIGMVQGRGGARFATKSFQGLGIAFHLLRKELQCHQTAKSDVLGLIHHSHSTAADFPDNAIVGNGLAYHLQNSPGAGTMLGVAWLASQSASV